MGAKESKQCSITFEEALKRVNETEHKRLREAFKRITPTFNGNISKQVFIKDVLGEFVPTAIAERTYSTCGGTARGIAFKELLCGLVVFTRGKPEEKIKFLYDIYSNESGSFIVRNEFQKFLMETESPEISNEIVNSLFHTSEKIDFEEFLGWIVCNKEATSLSRWLLIDCNSISLNNELEMPTFYQTLAGVTHLDEADIIELEKIYWILKDNSKSGKLDIETLTPLISPPIRLNMCTNLFNVFDENRDGHIDFKEMACGISAACRGPLTERQKFYFKVFDADRDGVLSDKEVNDMIDNLIYVYQENSSHNEIDKEVLIEDIKSHQSGKSLTMEEYVMWTVHNNLSMDFLNLIFQVCHIVFGLKPVTRKEEGEIILGWTKREEMRGYQVGQFWYLINAAWWGDWYAYVTAPVKAAFSADVQKRTCSMPFLTLNSSSGSLSNFGNSHYATQRGAPSRPGPIDNSNLIVLNNSKVQTITGEGGKLKAHMSKGEDYELVPDVAWNALKRWYSPTIALPRQAIKCPNTGKIELELYPLNLKILKHHVPPSLPKIGYSQTATWSSMVGGYSAAALIGSNAYSYMTNMNNSLTPKKFVAYRATFSRLATIKQVYVFLCNRLKIRPEDMRLWKYHDEDNMLMIEDEDISLENLGVCDDDAILMEIRNKDLTWPEEIGSLANNNVDKHKQKTERGATGLNNLGNTCFMNSALQCVSNTQPLTLYFTKNMHHFEFNRTNPLGMKGHIAKRYGDLIHDIWSGTAKTVAPLKLRWTIGKYAPRFTGYQQHDSQELLAFLLDGLHEDLNRVQDKPYLELKDSECRPDVAVAQEAWENHLLRNKSIIVDLFHGQLKSKVTCKICGHESVRFDPFNYLSLPLPMESYVHLQIAVIRLNGTVPVKYGLRLNAEDKYATVKQQISQLTGLPTFLLQLTEVSNAQIKNVLMDEQKVKPTNGSVIYAYELPVAAFSSGSMSGDEERLSISSIKSSHRDAAQTFTTIQRTVRPGSQSSVTNGQMSISNEDSGESAVGNSVVSSTTGDVCCSESADSGLSGTDCSDILLEEMSGRLTVDSGHCSASSGSLAESTDSSANGVPSLRTSYIVAIHRKMNRKDVYFVSSQKSIPNLFGLPVIVPCNDNTTHAELYQSVWLQVSRFVSPLPPSEATILNHALDCDDSLGYEFPFMLKAVNKEGTHCAWCPWHKFCRGCVIQCDDAEFACSSSYIAIDWDPTALHLRYQTSQETAYECVGDQWDDKQAEPIDLSECLEAFTREEHLSDDEKYYCSKCKQHQLASKKLQIWRLPPILIIHLKRFQFLHGRWVKSQKVVKFPYRDFDITDYLAALPNATINRYKQMKCKRTKKEMEHNTDSMDVTEMINIDNEFKDKYKEKEDSMKSLKALSVSGGDEAMDTQKRKRLESTSLSRTPIDDSSLQDFHQHKLRDDVDPFDLKYHLYSIVCHSGILGGGHYVSYASNPNGKWYCYNDSSCREVSDEMDTDCAYMLFYEREGLDYEKYLPDVSNRKKIDIMDVDTDFESDYKKMCHVM